MGEGYRLRLQVEAVSLVAVKLVAYDGASQSVGMGAAHAQLMRPAVWGHSASSDRSPLFSMRYSVIARLPCS